MSLQVKVINRSKHALPEYQTAGAACMDVRANIEGPVTLKPRARTIIPTGLFFELPANTELQVRPRSGLAAKNGVTVLNTPGTIDSDYRGELQVILINLGQDNFTVNDGDRIAQLMFQTYTPAELIEVSELSSNERGSGGFGSTGVS